MAVADLIFVVVLLALTLAAAEYVRSSARRQLSRPVVARRVEAHAEAE